jgi:hypothetical protein
MSSNDIHGYNNEDGSESPTPVEVQGENVEGYEVTSDDLHIDPHVNN